MASEGRRTVHRPEAGEAREPHCPACGQPVGTAIKRRKVLGAWVPVWRPRPCHNPQCVLFGRTPHEAKDWAWRKKRRGSQTEPGNSTKIG
ncbi:hypothetical protein ACFPM3_27565 [Streptomyces coeruleoprunus]|uniref:Uncharacterized protein n=1 Tax=Streptomyces coeruleoprunus TaxID=285563 RepID=A0ABV9XLG9_9ACTN